MGGEGASGWGEEEVCEGRADTPGSEGSGGRKADKKGVKGKRIGNEEKPEFAATKNI